MIRLVNQDIIRDGIEETIKCIVFDECVEESAVKAINSCFGEWEYLDDILFNAHNELLAKREAYDIISHLPVGEEISIDSCLFDEGYYNTDIGTFTITDEIKETAAHQYLVYDNLVDMIDHKLQELDDWYY